MTHAGTAQNCDTDPKGPPDRTAHRLRLVRTGSMVLVLAVLLPFVLQPVIDTAQDWLPLSDDAAVAIKAHDVLTHKSPLLGMPSTVGTVGDEGDQTYQPGPMVFWALAVPARLLSGTPTSLAVGVALVNAVAVVLALLAARRNGGTGAFVVAALLSAALLWSLGGAFSTSPWNPHVALLPFTGFLFVAWAVAAGDRKLLPVAVVLGSLAVQAHFQYLVVVAAVTLVLGALTIISAVRQKARAVDPVNPRKQVTRALTATAVGACWWPTAYEQLTNHPGNLVALVRAGGSADVTTVSLRYAVEFGVRAIATVPLFLRGPISANQYARVDDLPPPTYTWIIAALIVAVLLVGGLAAWRRQNAAATAAAALGLTALAAAVLTVDRLPVQFPALARYRVLPLWGVGVFVWFATAVVALDILRSRWPRGVTSSRLGMLALAPVIVLVVLADVAIGTGPAPNRLESSETMRLARNILDDLRPALRQEQTYRLTVAGRQLFSTGIYHGLFWDLLRRGVDVRAPAADPYIGRSHAGVDQADVEIVVRPALAPPPRDVDVVGRYEYIDHELIRNNRAYRALLERSLRNRPPVVTAAGRRLAAARPSSVEGRTLEALEGGDVAPAALIASGVLDDLAADGQVELDPSAALLNVTVESGAAQIHQNREGVLVYLDRVRTSR